MDVFWSTVYPTDVYSHYNMLYREPQLLLPELVPQRGSENPHDFFACPAFHLHAHNTFVVRSALSGARRFVLKRIAGKWRIPPTAIVDRIGNAALHEVGGRYVTMAHSFDEVTASIKSHDFPDAAQAAAAAEQRVGASARGDDAQ